MRLEGSLDAFSLPDIFALLSMTKKTGGLHLRRSHAHGVVWFTTGALTGGASDVGRQSLARRVAGSAALDLEALRAAAERAAGDAGVGVVRALQQAEAVDEGLIHEVTGEHIVDTVFDLLRWPDGDFEFVVDEANPDDVGVSRQVDDVVGEARRRLDAWSQVAATIPSPQTVLSVPAVLDEDPHLSRDEWSLLALVDGRRGVGEIVTLSGRGEFAVVSALAELVGRGLLRVSDGDTVSALLAANEVLAVLESGPARPAPEPAAAAEPTVEIVDFRAGADEADSEDEDEDEDDDVEEAALAAVTKLAAVPAQPTERAEITPKRPEPFLPKRQPEHPEEPMPAVAAGGGAAPAAATYIERDPSVNKSLLLRLIAGVRGL